MHPFAGERLRTVCLLAFRLVKNVDLLDHAMLLIGQEAPLRSQTSSKRGLYEGRDRAYGQKLTVIHCQFVLKVHQTSHLLLIKRFPSVVFGFSCAVMICRVVNAWLS